MCSTCCALGAVGMYCVQRFVFVRVCLFVCLLNIKLTILFKVKFSTNYENIIHIFPNFREVSLSHIFTARTHTHSHTYTHAYTCTHTYTYTHQQNCTCLRRNTFSV